MVTTRRYALLLVFKLFDIALLVGAFIVACVPVLGNLGIASFTEFLAIRTSVRNFALFTALLLLWHSIFSAFGLYESKRIFRQHSETLDIAKATSFATVALSMVGSLFHLSMIRPLFFLIFWLTSTISAVMSRWVLRFVLKQVRLRGRNVRNVLIVGADSLGQELSRHLEKNKEYGFAVKGFLDANRSTDPRMLGKIEDFSTVVRSQFIDEVFITIPAERAIVKEIVLEARRLRLDVKVVPDLYEGLARRAPMEYMGDFPVMSLHEKPIPVLGLFVKRTMDVMISFFALLLTLPILVGIAIAIKLDSPGPVFYCAPRKGKKGVEFICYKFRTMVNRADTLKADLRRLSEREGPVFKMRNDPRITRVGKSLRRSSLDELPQLINVLNGDMSLVGPRPHPVDDCRSYTLEYLRRMEVVPGLTGLWQISARRDPSFDTLMALDLKYIETWNLWLDIKVLLKTIPAVLSGSGE